LSRIPLIPQREFDDELAALTAALDTPFAIGHMQVFAHMPELAKAWVRFVAALHADGTLPRRLIELVRLRIAFHNQCRHCMAARFADGWQDGVDEELVCSLERPEESHDLSDAERAALRYADLVATDHLDVNDATFEDLRRHFTDREIVELGVNIATFVGFGRIGSTWDVEDAVPDSYVNVEKGTIRFGRDGLVVGATGTGVNPTTADERTR
jgi:AhpD family alkylhydroperoxidase